ncbi:hypothetical protein [Fusobacterium polymorphum]|uniref:hypothetical protein n=1 Tax=Fusobacterium nucleatum subsp. polymorphum TaxID=76857 RepID=UPI00300A1765
MKLFNNKLSMLSFIFIKRKVEYNELIKINKLLTESLIQDKLLILSEHYVEDFPLSYNRFYRLSFKGIIKLFFYYICLISLFFLTNFIYPLVSQLFNDYVLNKILS